MLWVSYCPSMCPCGLLGLTCHSHLTELITDWAINTAASGVRQGCVLSPRLFTSVFEWDMQKCRQVLILVMGCGGCGLKICWWCFSICTDGGWMCVPHEYVRGWICWNWSGVKPHQNNCFDKRSSTANGFDNAQTRKITSQNWVGWTQVAS